MAHAILPTHIGDLSCSDRSGKVCLLGGLVVILLILAAVLTTVFVLNARKDDTGPTNIPTVVPSTCIPAQSYEWVKDVALPSKGPWRTNLFSGNVTFYRMLSICNRIGTGEKEKWYRATYLNSEQEESSFNRITRDNMDAIFKNQSTKRMMWTGCYYYYSKDKDIWMARCQKDPLTEYNNFCSKNWYVELMEVDKEEIVYIVKDYETSTFCWKFYSSKQLALITDQPAGAIPRLPFACISPDESSTSGQDAMPGFFKPKWQTGNYLLFGVTAGIEDAEKECQSHDYRLVTVDHPAKLADFQEALRKRYKSPPLTRLIWTGGYFDVSNDVKNTKNVQWLGSPNLNTIYKSSDPFSTGTLLDTAATKLLASIDIMKNRTRDCGRRDYVYMGLGNPNAKWSAAQKGLIPMEWNKELDHDQFYLLVACEKKNE